MINKIINELVWLNTQKLRISIVSSQLSYVLSYVSGQPREGFRQFNSSVSFPDHKKIVADNVKWIDEEANLEKWGMWFNRLLGKGCIGAGSVYQLYDFSWILHVDDSWHIKEISSSRVLLNYIFLRFTSWKISTTTFSLLAISRCNIS